MTVLAAAVAAHRLPTRHVLPTEPLSDDEFAELLHACERDRLLGFLGLAVGSEALPVTERQRDDLEAMLAAWSSHAVRMEQVLLRTLELLAEAGIPSRVLKGVALAHTVYAQPEVRVFGDVDLLVSSADLDRAVRLLSIELDAPRVQPELRSGFDARFGKEVLLRVGDRMELDLHRIFVEGPFGLTIQTPDLFAPPYRFALAGYELEALPMPQRLLHACYAAALGDWPPRLASLRDVVELILREQPQLIDVLLMARAWRCEIVVARAVTMAWRELAVIDEPVIVAWARGYRPGRTDRMLLTSYEGPARAFTRHVAALFVLPTAADRIAYARAIMFPQREYLHARGLSASSHAQRAWRRLRG